MSSKSRYRWINRCEPHEMKLLGSNLMYKATLVSCSKAVVSLRIRLSSYMHRLMHKKVCSLLRTKAPNSTKSG